MTNCEIDLMGLTSSKKDKVKKTGEQHRNAPATQKEEKAKNGCKKAPRPYDEVDVDEHGAEVKSEPNEFQKPKHKLRPYDDVDIQPGQEDGDGGAVEVLE